MVTRECFVREKAVRVQGKVLAVYFDFLYCFQRCISVKIFAEIGFCWEREKVLLGRERFAVVLKRTEICLFFNRVFVLSDLSWYQHNPLLTVGF